MIFGTLRRNLLKWLPFGATLLVLVCLSATLLAFLTLNL